MDPNDDDLQMLDVPPEGSPKNQATLAIQDMRPIPRPMSNSTSSLTPARSTIPNGFQGPQHAATPANEKDGFLTPGPDIKTANSRQTSVLANDVAAQLSIETDMSDNASWEDEIDDEDSVNSEEHEKSAPYSSFLPTGYCYDVRMRYHCEHNPPKERQALHPEDPRRIFKIYQELCIAGLIKNPMLNRDFLIPNPLLNIPVRQVTEAEVELVHDKKLWDNMKATARMSADDLFWKSARDYDSVYINPATFACALLSAGGAIETCRAVMTRQARNAIAIIRPPGHHAECNKPMGFCIFDNVSIATRVCMKDFGDQCRRVLIVDWDVHHGNGIQQAFYNEPNVLYISLHVHEDGNFYPPGPDGNHLHSGSEAAQGKNINIPWPTKGMGDADYMFAFQHVVMPVAREFDPDFIIIAAGFDAAAGDQLGGCFVTPPCYAHMTHELMSLAQGKLVVCLEGGYNFRSISKSALAVTRTLVGETPDRLQDIKPSRSGIETVQMVAMHQSKWWPSIYPKNISQDILDTSGAERMHDVVRYYQASKMAESHGMYALNILQEKLSKSFDNQVMVTPNFEGEVPLLVLLHDAPEIMEVPNPMNRKLELHNTWMADGLKYYVDWAVSHGFGVIDANIPKYLTGVDAEDGYHPSDFKSRIHSIQRLAEYLWDNYIDCNEATEIFFIGVGLPHQGIVHLLNTRTQAFTASVTGIVNFIDGPLASASEQVLYDKPKWYKFVSMSFLARDHPVSGFGKEKRTKRWGSLVQSSVNGLNDMLVEQREEVKEFIEERVVREE